jgi:site-specific DNA-methyltransferase (adenine-specific)
MILPPPASLLAPRFQTADATLYRCDSIRACWHLEDVGQKVDAILTDPPYSSGGLHRSDRTRGTVEKYMQTGAAAAEYIPQFAGDNRDQRSYGVWLALVLTAAFRVCREGAICAVFTDWRQLGATQDALQVGGFTMRGVQPWLKPKGAARPRAGGFWDSGEFVVWGTAGPLIPGDEPLYGDGYVQARSPKNKLHVAEKPAEVCDWLCQILRPGETMLDLFAGSGALGVAAVRRGCKAILVEGEEVHCATISERLGDVGAQASGTSQQGRLSFSES